MKLLMEITKNINAIIGKKDDKVTALKNICNEIGQRLLCGVLLIDTAGKVITHNDKNEFDNVYGMLFTGDKEKFLINNLKNEINNLTEKKENINLSELDIFQTIINIDKNFIISVVPLNNGGDRIGTVIFYREDKEFSNSDLMVIEIFTIISSLTLLQVMMEEKADMERNKNIVKAAISTFSYSELEAIVHLFNALEGDEGIIIASKVADEVGITRSVIVNAIRKFESAGVIESRSLGMKGTYIKTLNKYLPEELEAIKEKFVSFR